LAVKWVLPPDVHVRSGDLDNVVTGSSIPSQAGGRNGPGVHDEEIFETPGVRHVLVAREDQVDAGPLEALERVARIVDDVALTAGARHGQQVMVDDEDLQVGRLGELLFDPAVPTASDLAVVQVRLARVDGDDGHLVQAEYRVARAEELLEVDVADVARIVVPGDHDLRLAVDALDEPLGEITTTSGSSSFVSAIARSSRLGRKNCCPQCRSDSWTIVKGRPVPMYSD
jgi:hypothetical protein